jgi:hypothetical protein
MLFRLFSACYFSKTKDNNIDRTMAQSQTAQGIAVGYSEIANGMEIYNPHTKQLYSENVLKIDENIHTANKFNLTYV